MSYSKKIQDHLSNYKKKMLSDVPSGKWQEKGEPRLHILHKDYEVKNLIGDYGRDFFENNVLDKNKLHICFHLLNSSQAMCINFFFPLIIEKKLDVILSGLGLTEEVLYETAKFEYESNIDNEKVIREKIPEPKQKHTIPTSFDFYFETKSNTKLYFEIKYTEGEFGSAEKEKNAEEYLDKYKLKYERIYKEAANGKIKNEKSFLDNYQIMRNLIHVENDSYVIFVVPEGNKRVYKQAIEAESFVVEEYKKKVKVLSWDNLYDIIEKQNFTGKLKEHFDEFKKKYKL